VPDAALLVVSQLVAAGCVAVVDGDVAVATGCSRREVGGWGVSRNAVGRAGSECHHF
jgi:hypothetical protein